MNQKISKIFIISKNNLVYQGLQDNIDSLDIRLLNNKSEVANFIKNPKKIDVLICDNSDGDFKEISYFAKYVFVFGDMNIRNSILLKKPISLKILLYEIKQSLMNRKLFCLLDDIIFDEIHSEIIMPDKNITKLTKKESEVIRNFIESKNQFLSERFLLQNIWKYSPEADTDTIKSHMSKLRSLLPRNYIEFLDEGYKLNVAKIGQ